MVKHVVVWKLKEEADGHTKAENLRRMKEKLEGMIGKVEDFSSLEVGLNVNSTPAAGDIVLITEHEDHESLSRYQANPLHREVASFVQRIAGDRVVVDFEV